MRAIFDSLTTRKLQPLTLPNEWISRSPNPIINQHIIYLAIANNSERATVIIGKGIEIKDALVSAIEKWLEVSDATFEVKHVKVDLLTEAEEVRGFDLSEPKIVFNTGLEGLAFDADFNLSFSPQEIEAYGIVKDAQLKSTKRMASALQHQINGGDLATVQTRQLTTLYKFTTESYYVNDEDTIELVRGHRIFRGTSRKEIKEAIKLSKHNYFRKVINKRGKQVYSYLPQTNLKEKRYNILRHAGTIYSILETIELFGGPNLLDKCKLSLDFLVSKMEKKVVNGEESLVLVERDIHKLGGNGLAIVALAKYTSLTNDRQYLPVMQRLATWIKQTQGDNGDFLIHKQSFVSEEIFTFRSDFYTGEAILALVRLYELDKNESWLDVAEKATHFLVNEKNKGVTLDTVKFDHWLLYGINNLSKYRPDESFLSHAMLMGESVMSKQFQEEEHEAEWVGGFPPEIGEFPKSVPVACRSEGLANIHALVKDKDPNYAKRIEETIHRAVEFQMQMQLREEKVMYFENKSLCLGAFHNKFKLLNCVMTLRNITSQV